MLVKTFGSAVYGLDAITITIEVNVTEGLHTFLVGLPDSAIKESIQRIESAIKSNGCFMPRTKLIINLAPAGIRKAGTSFDLPIALGILAASQQIPEPALLKDYCIMGELGLDGSILPIKGALPIAMQSAKQKFKGLMLPARNEPEASLVKGLNILPFAHLRELMDFFNDPGKRERRIMDGKNGQPSAVTSNSGSPNAASLLSPDPDLDFRDVKGQQFVKRAMEITAAGGHNALLIGPPGAGKTMLARRLPSILPPLTEQEALETTSIYSVAGKMPRNGRLITLRPFRSPHHTISAMALVGGGSIPQPGEISMAHNGVLFLDELPEFTRNVLEVLRQPMEERKVTISRARMSMDFPASFILVASMNPCPCGYLSHAEKECTCVPGAVFKYLHKISGPLLDRIDLHIEVLPVPYAQLSATAAEESSSVIRSRVMAARQRQQQRFAALGEHPSVHANAQMSTRVQKETCQLEPACQDLLKRAMNSLSLSARGHDRILKVSRTIADLAGERNIRQEHIAEALLYRKLDRDSWGL